MTPLIPHDSSDCVFIATFDGTPEVGFPAADLEEFRAALAREGRAATAIIRAPTFAGARALFDSFEDMLDSENTILSVGDEFLPPCARAVKRGGPATPEYWAWMIQVVADMEE